MECPGIRGFRLFFCVLGLERYSSLKIVFLYLIMTTTGSGELICIRRDPLAALPE